VGLFGIGRAAGVENFIGVRGDLLGVFGDEIFLNPAGALRLVAKLKISGFGGFDELASFFGRGRRRRFLRVGGREGGQDAD
jgi:hypothetical protein